MTTPFAATQERQLHDAAQGSSFHAAMLLLPKGKRKALLTLYAVCRVLDDAVDDAPDHATARSALDGWQAEMDAVFADGLPVTALAQDFQEAHQHYGFHKDDMEAMLDALRMDAEGRMCRPPLALLERYCYGVASAVGLLSMRIFGDASDHARPFAIALGHALQRTNILRDVRRDAAMGRIYLPQEWLEQPLTPAQLQEDAAPVHTACRLAEQAREYFLQADSHGQHLPPRAIAPALAMRDVYALYWRKLAQRNWESPADGRIPLSTAEKAHLASRAGHYMLGRFKPVDL